MEVAEGGHSMAALRLVCQCHSGMLTTEWWSHFVTHF